MKLEEHLARVNAQLGKIIRAADAKEVGVGNPAEETYRYPNQIVIDKLGRVTLLSIRYSDVNMQDAPPNRFRPVQTRPNLNSLGQMGERTVSPHKMLCGLPRSGQWETLRHVGERRESDQ